MFHGDDGVLHQSDGLFASNLDCHPLNKARTACSITQMLLISLLHKVSSSEQQQKFQMQRRRVCMHRGGRMCFHDHPAQWLVYNFICLLSSFLFPASCIPGRVYPWGNKFQANRSNLWQVSIWKCCFIDTVYCPHRIHWYGFVLKQTLTFFSWIC